MESFARLERLTDVEVVLRLCNLSRTPWREFGYHVTSLEAKCLRSETCSALSWWDVRVNEVGGQDLNNQPASL
jgi:hypothetical protein